MRVPEVSENWLPKSVIALRSYSGRKFVADLGAGVTVGLVALPLALAFAIASGVPPQAGVYCAVIAGFLISALGGSMTQIGGPTGAFVVVVSGIVQTHGLDGLFMCTLMAGLLLVAFGLTGLGATVRYIPRPVVIGFTNGIAILIASTQLKDFFGLEVGAVPGEFLDRMELLITNAHRFSAPTTALSVVTFVVLVVMMLGVKRVPGAIVALLLGTFLTWVFKFPVDTVGARFGALPSRLPELQFPQFRPDLILPLVSPALTVALLGAIESLLSAVVADRLSGDRHNPNVELVAQGVANVFSPLFGGLPATGAIARTATNVRSGAQTPVAGMLHAVTLLVVLLVAAPLAREIPLAVLAAILMIVAYNMGEWREIGPILRSGKAESAVWLITLLLTVMADLTVAVEVGMVLAALLYVQKVTATSTVSRVTPEYVAAGIPHSLQTNPIPPGVAVYRIHGPFLFGATDKIEVVEQDLPGLPPVVVLRLRNMTAIDATGIHALENLHAKLKSSGRHLVLCGLRKQPARLVHASELAKQLGTENIRDSLADAVTQAEYLIRHSTPPDPSPR